MAAAGLRSWGGREHRGKVICSLKIPMRDFFMPSLHSKAKGEGGDQHCGLRVGWDPSFTHPRAAMGDTEAVPGEPHCQGTGEWHFTEREKNREEKAMCRLEESGRSRVVLGVWSSPKSLEPLSAPTEPVPYSISST